MKVNLSGDPRLDPALRRAGLDLGAGRSVAHASTCGVGRPIATGQALTVHHGDHFDATHIPLFRTAALRGRPRDADRERLLRPSAGQLLGRVIQWTDGGTLLLDEIGDMAHALQARLLRASTCSSRTTRCRRS